MEPPKDTKDKEADQPSIPKAVAFAAFPIVESNVSLLGEDIVPAEQSKDSAIGSIRQPQLLGGQARYQIVPSIETSAPSEVRMAEPIYELQSLLTKRHEQEEEPTEVALEGEKLPEDYRMSREGLQMRIRVLEDELSEMRESIGLIKKRDAKAKAFLDYVSVLGTYYMKNSKYYDKEGWCTNWFWSTKPNFENPDGSKVPTRRGEDGKYYIKPNAFICALCNAATSKFWV